MSWKNAIRMMTVALALMGAMALPGIASAQVAIGISVGFAPPEIPVYEQPICPGEGYIWTPGYWAWDDYDQDYYWVPGTWVIAPQVGYLWTPGYWGWGGSAFFFHEGYWGPRVGFYGGINYGFGYFGRGYEGGRWDHDRFYYNTRINNVNTTIIHNTYNTTIVNRNETRVSYNGGNGGVRERPRREEEAAARERHISAVAAQQEHVQAARSNRELRASENHGRPAIAATERPGAFRGGGVVAARSGGNYNPPANRGPRNNERTNAERTNGANDSNRPSNANRTENNSNRPPNESRTENNSNRPSNAGRTENNSNRPPSASNGGNSNNRATYNHPSELPRHSAPQADNNVNQRYQQQQEKMVQKQNQEHQRLQQKQDQEHQRVTQQRAPEPRQQQMEQKHQQQTQQLEQRHTQQQQKMEQRQQPRQQAPPHQGESKPHDKKP